MVKRLGKEYKFDTECVKTRIGTTNRETSETFYVSGTTWVTPTYEGKYERDIKETMTIFKNDLKSILRENNLSPKFIMDYTINYPKMENGKMNYMDVVLHLKQYDDVTKFTRQNSRLNKIVNDLFGSFKKRMNEEGFEIKKVKD